MITLDVFSLSIPTFLHFIRVGKPVLDNNSQSQYLNILNIVQGGVYIYESESIAIWIRNIMEYGSNHRNAMSEHGIGSGSGCGTKLETEILRVVLVIPKFEHGTKFQESRESVVKL